MERIPPDKREQWEHQLVAPLPGREAKASPIQIEMEGQDFMAAMMAFQGG